MVKTIQKLRKILGTQGEPDPQLARLPLFITGTMRSGTTLLVNKLSEHPQLFKIGDELNHIWTEIGGASCVGICEHKNENEADNYYTYQMTNYFSQYIHKSKNTVRKLMRLYWYQKHNIGRINYDWDEIVPMNKSTHLMNKIGYVNGLFPGAKIILIIRDIYGQSSSQKFHFDEDFKKRQMYNFVPDDTMGCWTRRKIKNVDDLNTDKVYPGNFSVIPAMWLRLNSIALDKINELPEPQRLVISYEDLVQNQSAVLKKVFGFIGLNPGHEHEVEKICNQVMKFRNTTTAGNPLNKWKKLLSVNEIEQINTQINENRDAYDKILHALESVKET